MEISSAKTREPILFIDVTTSIFGCKTPALICIVELEKVPIIEASPILHVACIDVVAPFPPPIFNI
jgi:hypothetical protein